MAGIGFELRRLGQRNSLLAPLASLTHAATVAAGPWLFTVASMLIVHQATLWIEDKAGIYAFRALVIYAFAISLIATAPVVNVMARQVADDLYLGRCEDVRRRFMAGVVFSIGLSGAAAALLFKVGFGFDGRAFAVAVLATAVVGALWPSLALCTAVRNYRAVTTAFVVGLVVAVVATTLSAFHREQDASLMLLAFTLGLGIVQQALVGVALATFGPSKWGILHALRELAAGISRYRWLAAGAVVGALALWVDKGLIWLSPFGQRTVNGLLNAPHYDGAMFIAYLVVIPGLALFITMVETSFFDAFRAFFASIRHHAPLAEVRRRGDAVREHTFEALMRIVVVQATLSAVLALSAPAVVDVVGLQYQQVGILRMGALAALFQFLFLACSSLLVFFDQHVRFAVLQLMSLILQAVLTMASLRLGAEYLGLGHLIASALCGFASMALLAFTFQHLEYLTFRSAWRQETATAHTAC